MNFRPLYHYCYIDNYLVCVLLHFSPHLPLLLMFSTPIQLEMRTFILAFFAFINITCGDIQGIYILHILWMKFWFFFILSTLVNTGMKGGAYPIMLQQFRRAICVAMVRGNSQHKLARLHYTQATPEESAAAACKSNHSNKRLNSNAR